MKNLVRFAVAGAMLAGFATAQAQSLPSTGASDLWLFVADTTTGTTFAEDLGNTAAISKLLPTSSLAAAGTSFASNTPVSVSGTSLNIAESSGLATFLGSVGSDSIEWGVLGAQYPTTTNAKATTEAPGGIVVLASEPTAQGSSLAGDVFGSVQTIASSFNTDLTYVNGTGVTLKWSAAPPGGVENVWGASTGDAGGSTNLYGQGPDQSGIALGQSVSLFGITGNGSKGQIQTYDLGDNLSLSASGVLTVSSGTTTPPPPVPLPAAVWLFGSGLLGLLGVGRRRAA
jgi:hypothetical protein